MIDRGFAELLHLLCVSAGGFFTPFFTLLSILADKGFIFVVIGFLLCLRKKTRWIGATIIFAIASSYLITDMIVKPFIARERPYLSGDNMYYMYWKDAGAIEETHYSMPSGHTIATSAFFVSLYISCKKSKRKMIMLIGIITTFLVVCSRCYFMHHYLTDCIIGIVFAFFMSYVSKVVIKLIYNLCKTYENIPLFNFVLNFDIADLFARKK